MFFHIISVPLQNSIACKIVSECRTFLQMRKARNIDLDAYVVPIIMNGLRGRMLRVPAAKLGQRDILFVYGTHSSLEQHYDYIAALSRYGAVTAPDLPGMGGMQSFFAIGIRPNLDAFADYLAAFVKLRYKRRRFRIVACSYGFAIVTRMLQRFPELARRVDFVVCVDGYVHAEDFNVPSSTRMVQRVGAFILSARQLSWITKHVVLRPKLLRVAYQLTAKSPSHKRNYDFEVKMWKQNDIRTYMYTIRSRHRMNLCTTQVELPVYYIAKPRTVVDVAVVEQHLGVIYSTVHRIRAGRRNDNGVLSAKLRKILSKT